MPSQEVIRAFFNRTYARDGAESMRAFEAYPVFLDYLGVERNKSLLDVGCGTGFLLKAACARGVHAYGIDLSEEAVKLSSLVAPEASVIHGDAERLNFETGSLDYITCLGTLEHFLNIQQGLSEIHRVGRENARFCFLVPNSDSPLWKLSMMTGLVPDEANENAFSLGEWTQLFTTNGFEIKQLRRDRWFSRWLLLKLGVPGKHSLNKSWVKYLPSLLPLRWTHQFVFLLRKKPKVISKGYPHAVSSSRINGESLLTTFYDHLSKFILLRNRIKYGSSYSKGVMHRKLLRLPKQFVEKGKDRSELDINDYILEVANLARDSKVLDAGCGFGGTIFQLYERLSGRWDGVTISSVQWRVAQEEAHRRNMQNSCYFYLQDYDHPPDNNYDAVLAIESLIYSSDIAKTISSWSQAMNPGGKLIVVDDFVIEVENERNNLELKKLRQYWELNNSLTDEDFRITLDKASLKLVFEEDLTSCVKHQSRIKNSLLAAIYRSLLLLIPLSIARSVLSAYRGALIVQRLYARGGMQYKIYVAEKKL